VAIGCFIQATVGLGLGLFGAPLIALIEPQLVPTLLLLLAIVVSTGVTVAEFKHIDWRVIAWALPARIPGTWLGVWLATSFSHRLLGIAVGVMVLVAVWLSFHTVEVRQTPLTLVGAGLAAGTTGTAVAVGGPPMALVMAHRPPREVRGTLSFFFVVGSLMSLIWFALVGELSRDVVVLGAAYLPLVGLALLLGTWTHRRIPREAFRRVVLVLCAASAVVLLVKSVLG
jgi:hypothetical protein